MINSTEILNSWKPEICVLGPGGMKGFLIIGALIKLFKTGYLDEVHTFIGCSVGVIISALLASGYKPEEIAEDALQVDIFHDSIELTLSDFKNNVGIISNRDIKKLLSDKIIARFGKIVTLKELYDITGITLVSVTLNLTTDTTEYLSWETEPNISVVDAALLSINIPLLFYKLEYKGNIYIDGAFGNPYPVDYLDNGKRKILGISITSRVPNTIDPVATDNMRYIYKVAHASITQLKKKIDASCSSQCRHLTLHSPCMDTTGISFTHDTKLRLLTIGYESAKRFLFSTSEISIITEEDKYIDIVESLESVQYEEC